MTKRFKVLYQKPGMTEDCYMDREIEEFDLRETHAEVAIVYAENLERVFYMMNDPYGEGLNPLTTRAGQEIVKGTEVLHTSMSINDVVQDLETGLYYRVAGTGFEDVL